MTLKTWKAEFYSKKPNKTMSMETAIQHSITKWEGLTPKNIKEHGLSTNSGWSWALYEVDNPKKELRINASTCALCVKYWDDNVPCLRCPLYKSLGSRCDEWTNSPYAIYLSNNNPQPMIKALRKTLKQVQAGRI